MQAETMSKFFLEIVEAPPIFAEGKVSASRKNAKIFLWKLLKRRLSSPKAKLDDFTENRKAADEKIAKYHEKLYFCGIF